MTAHLDADGFHPDDPTKRLWKRLLRRKPIPHNRAELTKPGKRELATKLQMYYLEHGHPRKGKPFPGPKKKK